MKSKKIRILLLILIAALLVGALAGLIALRVADSRRPHSAADFGFEEPKSPLDADGDGVDDYTDMVLGARAYIATKPVYKSAYFGGGYPTDGTGVCTDVIWNAFMAAGYSLKDLVDADIAAAPEAYFKDGERADPNIDFRRVRNLLVFFRRNATELTTSFADPSDWAAGDIVIFDGHIAICSDVRNARGIPYIIHHGNIVEGAVEADQMRRMPIVAHFRWPGPCGAA